MENQTSKQSFVSEDMEITGTIKTSGSMRIDGKVDGEVQCGGDVVIGKGAQVKANLSSNSISVEGSVTGNISAKDKIELKASARVMGDIRAKRMAMEDGVTFVGKSEVNPSGAASKAVQEEEEPEGEEDTRTSKDLPGLGVSSPSPDRGSPFAKRK